MPGQRVRNIKMPEDIPDVGFGVPDTGYREREIRVGDWVVDATITTITAEFWVVEVDIELATSTVVNVVRHMPFDADAKKCRLRCRHRISRFSGRRSEVREYQTQTP